RRRSRRGGRRGRPSEALGGRFSRGRPRPRSPEAWPWNDETVAERLCGAISADRIASGPEGHEGATGRGRWRLRRSAPGRPLGSDSARHRHAQEDRASLTDFDELTPRIEVEQKLPDLVGLVVELDLTLRVACADVGDVDAPADDAPDDQLVGSDREV